MRFDRKKFIAEHAGDLAGFRLVREDDIRPGAQFQALTVRFTGSGQHVFVLTCDLWPIVLDAKAPVRRGADGKDCVHYTTPKLRTGSQPGTTTSGVVSLGHLLAGAYEIAGQRFALLYLVREEA